MTRIAIELIPRDADNLNADLTQVRQIAPDISTINLPICCACLACMGGGRPCPCSGIYRNTAYPGDRHRAGRAPALRRAGRY